MQSVTGLLKQFIAEHQLPESYASFAQKWFIPLASKLALHQKNANKPIFVGVNGCQGSGKSTVTDLLVALLQKQHNIASVGISIDDFYLSKSKRNLLSKTVHPLLSTRGVPGTHDTELMQSSINNLLNHKECLLPVFDKSIDDVKPRSQWREIRQHYDIVILEGWCVGLSSQPEGLLTTAINALENNDDPDSMWRNHVNSQLKVAYEPLFNSIDQLVMLKAPSFDCVSAWRCEQEHKLIARLQQQHLSIDQTMTDQQINKFIQYYQRLTEHALETLPSRANYIFALDANRGITSCQIQ